MRDYYRTLRFAHNAIHISGKRHNLLFQLQDLAVGRKCHYYCSLVYKNRTGYVSACHTLPHSRGGRVPARI